MEEKKYVCGFCGKEYETVVERMNCESACAIAEKEKAEKERREKLIREKEERQQKIIQSRKELLELEQNYYRDYGEYVYVLREPVKRTADFNEDWDKYLRDVFKKFYW